VLDTEKVVFDCIEHVREREGGVFEVFG